MSDAKTSDLTKPLTDATAAPRQERSRATRRELIAAAREIFARDGFELARLEDIAAAAGKTRGAFYAHFQDKEDVFFAIFEQDLREDTERVRRALEPARSTAERMEALTDVLAALVTDHRRMLLSIEFKLYAIRRPHQQQRLTDLHAAMKLCCAETHIDALCPEFAHTDPREKRERAAHFASLLEGLALNRFFDTTALPDAMLRAHIRAGVEAAFLKVEGTHPS